jgi:glycosyltransferase involved in cell wall biosynthesis
MALRQAKAGRSNSGIAAGVGALKVLLSAYACEPGKGSEPGMGWHWAMEIARLGHEVHILTRANNVASLERVLPQLDGLRLFVHGYDLPPFLRWWKRGQRGAHLYYALWQWGAYRRARSLHRASAFDLVHHITLAVYRHPSFMGRLGIPFVFGPVGGGEDTPPALRASLPGRARVLERLRSTANRIASNEPLVISMFRQAALIFYKTTETLAQIPGRFHAKCVCIQDVASDEDSVAQSPAACAGPHFLYAGRLLYWKGVHLALRALALVRAQLPDATLTIVGAGSDRAWLEGLAGSLGLQDAVAWRGWLAHAEVLRLYASHTAFVFPSLHDSGGTVVMEAMAQGLPVLCLDLGGPGAILPADCGVKIPARGRTEDSIVADLAAAMISLATDPALQQRLAADALKAARACTWGAIVRGAYAHIANVTGKL